MGTPLSYHQANVCVLYTVLLHQLRTRYTHRVTVMCGSRLFRSIETNSNERPHKFHFSLQIGFFKCCYCCVPYFLRLIMCKRKGVFFFFRFSVVRCCEKYEERTPSIQGAMGNRERNNPVINCEPNITRSPTHGVCWHRYHSSAHSMHTAERGLRVVYSFFLSFVFLSNQSVVVARHVVSCCCVQFNSFYNSSRVWSKSS